MSITNTKEVGNIISELRKERGLTQRQLAEMVFVSPSTISKWENGDAIPDIYRLKELSEVFQVSVSELLGEEEQVMPLCNKAEQCEESGETILTCLEQSKIQEGTVTCEEEKEAKVVKKRKSLLRTGILIVVLVCVFIAGICIFQKSSTVNGEELRFEVVDEFYDDTSKHWGYESVYHVVVEFDGEINSDAQLTYAEALKKKYKKFFSEVSVIKVTFFSDYKGRDEVFDAKYHIFILPEVE